MNPAPDSFGLLPRDAHDQRLLANVHPADWPNPRAAGRYHLVVIGGGTAGLVTAAIATALGARVALIERRLLGGDCLNTGCVPSKALIRAARGWHAAQTAAARFGGPAVAGAGDFAEAMERMRRIRAEISVHDSAARFRSLGADVFLGDATFVRPDAVEVAGQTLRFRRAVIAAGSRAALPPIPGLAEAGCLTNETVFSLTTLPRRLLVIGGGAVGCELAQSFARFGSQVTLLEAAEHILPAEDAEAAEVVARALAADGVAIRCGVRVVRVERGGGERGERTVHYEQGGVAHRVVADELLVAAGRTPNVEGLGLERAGITFDPRRGVVTDPRMRTANPHVYAIGDIATRTPYTHAADAQARMVVRNALFWGRGRASDLLIPRCTYTAPELAHVGISPAEARERGSEVEAITVAMHEVDRARTDGEAEGFLRIYLKKGSDRILGATLVGEHAGELISQVTQAMTAGAGLGVIGDTIFPYPTRAEILRKAADQWRRRGLTPLASRVFAGFFRALR